ncbi:glycerophosphodiester phosphodiesterase [Arthrobacter zhaoguopingii]|uniref:glycerophosphodiester phosphodiesterase n=1 Tax=Arthrobacter zhaoguopingii TaxID=2681491 RepID=UPI0013568826|nr:glycerophosphodiester phosphodiesterase [Arthrobacter zhaoguopingii]
MTLAYFQNTGPDGRQRPLGFSHRGFSPAGAENSLSAFADAARLGFGYLEIDVRSTRDGVVMVFHDETLDRVTDARGPIAARTRAELAGVRIRGGEPIPTLEEVLLRWPEMRLNIDIKDEGSVKPFADLINRLRAHDRVLVASFSDFRRLRVLRRLEARTASSAGMAVNGLIRLGGHLGLTGPLRRVARVDAVQVPLSYRRIPVVTPGYVRRCRKAGLQVHVWTINEPAAMERLLDQGVDGLVSDRADQLADVLNRRGSWPQGRPAQTDPPAASD